MRRLLISLLLFISLIGCSALSKINDMPNLRTLESIDIDRSGGILEVNRDNKSLDGVSIEILEDSVPIETKFTISYYESFPRKPKNMKAESIAFEFKFDVELSRRALITIPFVTENVTLKPIALFNLDMDKRIWHFAGCVKINKSEKTISTLIMSSGIYAVMSYDRELPRSALTDFEVGFDTINADLTFTKEYSNAVSSYAFWYYNNKRDTDINLYDKYDIYNSSTNIERISLLVAQAASWEFHKSQFTTVPDVLDNVEVTNKVIADTIKTALAFENRPVIGVMSVQNNSQMLIINKYDNNDFSCYVPYISKNELIISYDGIDLVLKDPRNVIATIDKIGLLDSLTNCNEGFESIYEYFENQTDNVLKESVGGVTGRTLTVNNGNLNGYVFDIPANAVTDDRKIIIDEIHEVPETPIGVTWVKPLFRITGPIDSMFNTAIEITIPDIDLNNDGYIDGTTVPINKVRIGAYNFAAKCWANTEINFGMFNDDLLIQSYYASDYAMFYFEPSSDLTEPLTSAVEVYDSWPTGVNELELISNLENKEVNTLNIVAYECHGFVPAIKRIGSMYNYKTLNSVKNDVKINLIISCFKFSRIDDVDAVDSISAYIAKSLIPDVIEDYPDINAIILEDTQYTKYGATYNEMEMLSKFILRVREQLGKKSENNIKLFVEVEGSLLSDCSNEYGQRITDIAKYADSIILILYDDQNQPYNNDDTSKFIENIKLSCSTSNNVNLIPKITTRLSSTINTIEDQLDIALRLGIEGFIIDDYSNTDPTEWGIINQFTP